jgi:aspartyl-tRNA synthetase
MKTICSILEVQLSSPKFVNKKIQQFLWLLQFHFYSNKNRKALVKWLAAHYLFSKEKNGTNHFVFHSISNISIKN